MKRSTIAILFATASALGCQGSGATTSAGATGEDTGGTGGPGDGEGGLSEGGGSGTGDDGAPDDTGPGNDDAPDDGDDDGPGPGVEVSCDDEVVVAEAPVDCSAAGCLSWCDAATWPDGVPGPQTDVVIDDGRAIVVDCVAEARSIHIAGGAALVASRDAASTLTLRGNLVVEGRLDYGTPDDRIDGGVTAEVIFIAPGDESYVGTDGAGPDGYTPATVLDSDVGMWIVGGGIATAAGGSKTAWSRLQTSVGPGSTAFTVDAADGWAPGDTVVLTPTASSAQEDHFVEFDELQLAGVEGHDLTLTTAPQFEHAGCDDGCWRRGEAANLTRSVVFRSQDDENHAHILAADQGVVQFDSVELRWLGPLKDCSNANEPRRRHALYFHQQEADSESSFVHHTAIWGGNRGFIVQEMSNGVSICDVAGYDGEGNGFHLSYDNDPFDREHAPTGTVYRHVLAARLRTPTREEGCVRIRHRMHGIAPDGGEGTGAVDCVTTGVGTEGFGADISGYGLRENPSGRPADFVFTDNVAHNNNGHGMFIWHNAAKVQPHYMRNEFWSNKKMGIRHGAYSNPYVFEDTIAYDNGDVSVGIKIVPGGEHSPLQHIKLDNLAIESYVLVQDEPSSLVGLEFSGEDPVAFTQVHGECGSPAEEMDPQSGECNLVWLRLVDPVFGEGVTQPFDFGWTENFYSHWDVEGFSHAAYPGYPTEFSLYRSDNEVAGGCYVADFDAWMAPCPD